MPQNNQGRHIGQSPHHIRTRGIGFHIPSCTDPNLYPQPITRATTTSTSSTTTGPTMSASSPSSNTSSQTSTSSSSSSSSHDNKVHTLPSTTGETSPTQKRISSQCNFLSSSFKQHTLHTRKRKREMRDADDDDQSNKQNLLQMVDQLNVGDDDDDIEPPNKKRKLQQVKNKFSWINPFNKFGGN